MKRIGIVIVLALQLGCAQGRIDVLDQDGKVVGHCSAEFYFHWYGAEDSVNYILQLCAKEHVAKGYQLSDASILDKDYSLPPAPEGKSWSKSLAKTEFSNGRISEEKLGYILASVEYQYSQKLRDAEDAFAQSVISQAEYEAIVAKAKNDFEGV